MRTILICGLWIVLGVLFLSVDRPLSEWMMAGGWPSDIRALFHRAEAFGHAYGLIFIAITIYLLDPQRRMRIVAIVSGFAAAGLSADLIKILVWRIRPCCLESLGHPTSTFAGTLWSSGGEGIARAFDSAYHSFPSAHTACAVALAYQLGRFYPAARHWFFVIAALCAMNRVDGGAHHPSDVCWGVALGYAVVVGLESIDWSESAVARWIAASFANRRGAQSDNYVRPVATESRWLA